MENDIILAQKINTYHHILMLQKKTIWKPL